MRSGVSKECGSRLPIWRDAVRSFSVDAAAYEPVLGALSVNATVCEYVELAGVLVSTMLRKYGCDVAYLVSAIGSPLFMPHIGVARVRHWFGGVK